MVSDQVRDRMIERGFNETDLREMLEHARIFTRDDQPGRWRIAARLGRRRWIVIVEPEPEPDTRYRVVVTAFAVH